MCEAFAGKMLDRGKPHSPGIVYEDIQPAFAGQGGRHRRNAFAVTEIGDDPVTAERRRGLLDIGGRSRRDIDPCAGRHEPFGDHAANSRGSSGDERDLSVDAEQGGGREICHRGSQFACAWRAAR